MKAPTRPRILALLDATVASSRITLLAAPSGFDKSLLLSAWLHDRAPLTAWLTLTRHERGDEDLMLAGILSALSRMGHAQTVSRADRVRIAAVTTARATIGQVIDAVAALGEDVVIVIDDAHHGGAELANGVVDVLVALAGGRLRFVLAGAPVLLTWFAGALASAQAAAITRAELALTIDEVLAEYAFWNVPLASTDAASLVASTSGWPIAVRMNRLGDAEVPTLALGGATRLGGEDHDSILTDFIAENLLAHLRPPLAAFVLATTTCTYLTTALARELSGEDESIMLLEECVNEGLFLDRYRDMQGNVVYRWNDNFAARCREILLRFSSARSRALNLIAARWLAPHFPSEAIMHAIRAENPETAVDIIRTHWIRVIVESGAKQLNAQCLSLPPEFAGRPEILAIRAACLNLLGDIAGSRMLQMQAIATGGSDTDFVAALAFASLFFADDPVALAAAADEARDVMERGTTDPTLNAYRLFLLGWVELRLRRNPPAAVRLLESAVHEAEASNRQVLAHRATENLVFALSVGGSFARAHALMAAATGIDEQKGEDWQHYDGGIVLFARGFIDFWQGRPQQAKDSLLALAEAGGHEASYAALARVFLAFCAADDGAPDAVRTARIHLDGISTQEMHGVPWPAYRAIADAALLAASGAYDEAAAVIRAVPDLGDVPVVRATAAEILRRGGRLLEASQILDGIEPGAMKMPYVAAPANLTAALIAHEHDDRTLSRTLFERALNAMKLESVLQPFANRDERYRALLTEHAAAGTAHSDFVASRITAFDAYRVAHAVLGVPLSVREKEIFGYLCTTMTAEEIADALFVSVNTIRTHQRAIYRKLGVASRREAVRFRL